MINLPLCRPKTHFRGARRSFIGRTGIPVCSYGFTLVELMLAIAILTIGILALASSMMSGLRLTEGTHERQLAKDAARLKLEQICGEPDFPLIYKQYNSVTADDPPIVVSPGSSFGVAGLTGPGGNAGTVHFPGVNGLYEDYTNSTLGFAPMDMTGDGTIDGLNHSNDYVILPVVVRMEWNSPDGVRWFMMKALIGEK